MIPKGIKVRRLHKAFLRYHDPENWPVLREALKRMGRADLIGNGKQHLIPAYQPVGSAVRGGAQRPAPRAEAVSKEPSTRVCPRRAAAAAARPGRRHGERAWAAARAVAAAPAKASGRGAARVQA